MDTGNLGRYEPAKAAFSAYILRGLNTLMPVTPALEAFAARSSETKLMICPDRMVDKAEELLRKYEGAGSLGNPTASAPLPVVLCAFAKDTTPILSDRGQAIANELNIRLTDDAKAPVYRALFDHVESRVQLLFIAHDSETARAMTSQMGLHLKAFENHRWPIDWHFGNESFTTTCSLEDYEPATEMVDLEGRTNITLLVWNVTLNFQIPYVGNPQLVIQAVDYTINDTHRPISTGVVDTTTRYAGRWMPR